MEVLYTEDLNDGQQYGGILARNPFRLIGAFGPKPTQMAIPPVTNSRDFRNGWSLQLVAFRKGRIGRSRP